VGERLTNIEIFLVRLQDGRFVLLKDVPYTLKSDVSFLGVDELGCFVC
jgi:hypothetical protein